MLKTLQKGVCYLVGSGTSINIWEDPWIPSLENFSPSLANGTSQSPFWVVDLMTDDRLHWNINKLNNLFDPPTVQAILKIHLSTSHSQDKIIWAPNRSGIFSMKSAYLQAQLPTRFFLSKKWDIEESSCPFCSSQPETSVHLVFGCSFAVITWSLSPQPLNPTNMND
jgi:hypothetical protein